MGEHKTFLFTTHAELCLEGQGLSEFGKRTAIANGVKFNSSGFSEDSIKALNTFRSQEVKHIYVSEDEVTWITAILLYYPYERLFIEPYPDRQKLALVLVVLPMLNQKRDKSVQNSGIIHAFLKEQGFELNREISLDYLYSNPHNAPQFESYGEWGIKEFMNVTPQPPGTFIACVTHHTTTGVGVRLRLLHFLPPPPPRICEVHVRPHGLAICCR